jgi:putative membrane protein
MKSIISLPSLLWFAAYFLTGVAMLALFTRIYIWFTPYDELVHIRQKRIAPALSLAGAMLGFTIPIVTVSYHGINYLDFIVWGVVAGAVQLICFKLLYVLMPWHPEDDNSAAATFFAGAAICVGLINAFSLIP